MNTKEELEEKIDEIFITIENYGTAEEARVDIRKLISERESALLSRLIGQLYNAAEPPKGVTLSHSNDGKTTVTWVDEKQRTKLDQLSKERE